jgi:hypothetical protein
MMVRVVVFPSTPAFFYDPSPSFGASPTPYILLMVFGFSLGVFGHIIRSRPVIATGIGLVFLATFLLPLATYVFKASE